MPSPVTSYEQDGFIIEATTIGSGTGNYESFLRIQANDDDEEGYNTDVGNQLDNKSGPWTHSLLISDLIQITVDGHDYYEIRLDLNEAKNGEAQLITMDELQLYAGPAAGAEPNAFVPLGTPIFDLDGSLLLSDTNHGSGTDDYRILIPVEELDGVGDYLTLYAKFSGINDGFEEFRAKSSAFVPTPDIGITKDTEGVDDDCVNLIVGGTVHWTYTVENNGNVPLTNVHVIDDNGTPGDDTDDFEVTSFTGDTHNIGVLDTDETWVFTASGIVLDTHYDNIATVTADYVHDDGEGGTITDHVSASEEACYVGVTPTIQVVKYANGFDTDCKNILVGQDVVYTYEVTNTSPDGITIDTITISDDNATVGTGDDFNPTPVLDSGHNIGDTHNIGVLDNDETWQYTYTVTAIADEQTNTVTVNGTAHDIANNTAPVTDDDGACYFGADPEIDIVKKTNGTDNDCPVVHEGEAVTWTYFVENTGNVGLTNIQIYDDGGTPDLVPGDELDDFIPNEVLSGGHNIGDLANFGVLDPGEIWQYTYSGVAKIGHYDNVAYVTGDYTDDFENSTTVDANESDCYMGVAGPGVRTPGFWANWQDFWNGTPSVPKQAGTDCFPLADLLYQVDKNGDGTLDSTPGLLIGDYDKNGVRNGSEDVFFISLADAQSIINAKNNQMSDGVLKIARDVIATWLNYLEGNPIGTIDAGDGKYSPKEAVEDAVDYLQIFGDKDNSNATGFIDTGDLSDCYSSNHKKVDTSSAYWNSNFPGGGHSGAQIHAALDEYNNFGTVNGTGYAASCDNESFVVNLNGFMTDQGLVLM